MTVHSTSQNFKQNAAEALADPQLQRALANVKRGFIDKRTQAVAKLPEFEALRDAARDIKDHTLKHLDLYLEKYEVQVVESGGVVHFARTAAEARDIIGRMMQPALAEELGAPVLIRNVGGAAGTVGAAEVARAKPDGTTLLLTSMSPIAIQPSFRPSVPYGVSSFAPV